VPSGEETAPAPEAEEGTPAGAEEAEESTPAEAEEAEDVSLEAILEDLKRREGRSE
jgi:hypothetical protein